MQKPSITLFIPVSLTVETQNKLLRNYKVWQLARAMTIFKIQKVVLYNDNEPLCKDQGREGRFIKKVLRYLATPPYLRKKIFPLDQDLRLVGALPPLQPNYSPEEGEIPSGETYRYGLIMGTKGKRLMVDVGLKTPIEVEGNGKAGQVVLVLLTEREGIISGSLVDKRFIGGYWGFDVSLPEKDLAASIRSEQLDVVIGTSRLGKSVHTLEKEMLNIGNTAEKVGIVFGGPYQGIHDILSRVGLKSSEVIDYMINVVPGQGTKTIRVEEAVFATLTLLKYLWGG